MNTDPELTFFRVIVVVEARRVEPVFPKKDQAIDYAQQRACFRSGQIRIFDSTGNIERVIPFDEADRKL
jgi:hypothetical protein